MRARIPIVLSTAALVVAILGTTPLGRAAGDRLATIVPFAKTAGFAKLAGNASQLNGHRSILSGAPGTIPVVGKNGKLPAAIAGGAPAGPAGPAGPKGDRGPKGDCGPKGDPGPIGPSDAYFDTNTQDIALAPGFAPRVATVSVPAAGTYVSGARRSSPPTRAT